MSKLLPAALALLSARHGLGDEVTAVVAGGADPRQLTKFGCLQFADTQGHGLRAVLGPNLENDWCSYQNATDTVPDIFATCEKFCGEGRIPVPLAVPTFGINHADMDQICLGKSGDEDALFGTYDPDLMARCRSGYEGLELVKSRASEVVKEVEVMRLEQLAFRVVMVKAMKDVSETVSSEEFTKWLMGYKNSEKIGKYSERLEALLADVLHSGDSKKRLEDAMGAIVAAVGRLNLALDDKVPILMQYVESCGRPVLAISSAKDYLMDVCNQNTNECMDDPEAQHVGCCCGTLPATGFFDIPADATGRRLAVDHALGIDVCFEAATRAKGDVDRLTQELLATTEGKELLNQYENALDSQYPTWTGDCTEKRRLPEVTGSASGLAAVPGRQLQDSTLLECTPPAAATVATDEVMKVAFSKDTEKNYCTDLTTPSGEKMTTVGLAEQCEAFCGSEAVPLLVGSIDFGFNQSAMDSVCINSNIVTADSAQVTQCLTDAEAMQAVDIKMSAFITAVTAVELAKLEYETAVAAQLPAIKAKIEEKAESVLKGARADQKAAVYAEFLRTDVFNQVAGSSQQAVKYKESLDRLGKSVESLQSTVNKSVEAYTRFLNNCSNLYTGKGTYNEYLLDQCSQTSEECVESSWGRHAGCCCGYTPFMAVGQKKVNFLNTIPGITAASLDDGSGTARVANRRLSEPSKTYYDICGSVWEGADELLTDFHSEIGAATAVYQDWVQSMKTRYPDAKICLFEAPPPTPAPTPGETPSPTPGGDGSPSPSPSPSGIDDSELRPGVSGAPTASAHLPALALMLAASIAAFTASH